MFSHCLRRMLAAPSPSPDLKMPRMGRIVSICLVDVLSYPLAPTHFLVRLISYPFAPGDLRLDLSQARLTDPQRIDINSLIHHGQSRPTLFSVG